METELRPAVNWPDRYLPGTTDNFVSNEVIVADLTAQQVWPQLVNTDRWVSYYEHITDISFPDGDGPELRQGMRFNFSAFGYPPTHTTVTEVAAPGLEGPGRLTFAGPLNQNGELVIDIAHAFLIEDLPGGRLRLLTQESELGPVAEQLATQRPSPLVNAHLEWLDGLVRVSRDLRVGS